MKRWLLFLAVLGCSERVLKPEEPIWGKQQCSHCAMLVSERPPSAQAVTAEGKRYFFDDIGCMVAWEDRVAPRVAARWVRAPVGNAWADPATSRFSGGRPTPMDFGFLPDAQGTVTFDQLRDAVREKARHPPGGAP